MLHSITESISVCPTFLLMHLGALLDPELPEHREDVSFIALALVLGKSKYVIHP